MSRPGVFLDRDGTLLDELGYLADPEGVRLLPGAAEGVRALNDAGLPVVVVTNQSGIARGLFDERTLAAVHRRLGEELERAGARLDAILFCPHHPERGEPPLRATCACRKPAPGLLLEAAERYQLDLAQSFLVGDARRDLEAGRRAGVPHRILVLTGKGEATWDELAEPERVAVRAVPDLAAAARAILAAPGA